MGDLAQGDGPPAKKSRTTPSDPLAVLNAALFSSESLTERSQAFRTAQPYSHAVLDPICDPAFLRKVRHELIHNVTATFKETDLFKVFQTGDLAAIDHIDPKQAASLPSLLTLRNALYSESFRDLLTAITGCAGLTDRVDMSTNVYADGHHLLCHDDVIGTRAVSFILYLTDPEEPWAYSDGGALELYPLAAPADGAPPGPATEPSAMLLPAWNTLALFTVQPGRSFHAVQEVFAEDKPRLSISGWFHRDTPPPGAEQATLAQLMSAGGGAGAGALARSPTDWGWGDDASDVDLTGQDRALLGRWVNPSYLARKALRPLMLEWERSSCIQLQDFLKPEVIAKLREATRAADEADALGRGRVPKYIAGAGEGSGWGVVGPAHKQRHCRFERGAQEAADGPMPGALLAEVRDELLASHAFAKMLHQITDLGVTGVAGEVRRFRPGLDYTVAHYGGVTRGGAALDATLCVVDDAAEENGLAWAADEVGGWQCYLMQDEEEAVASEVYKQAPDATDAGGEIVSCSASCNTLNIVLRDEGLMKFVKYVGHCAPGSRWDVAMEYDVDVTAEEMEEACEAEAASIRKAAEAAAAAPQGGEPASADA